LKAYDLNIRSFINLKGLIKDYFFISLGLFIVAFSNYFLLFPKNLIIGGLGGLAAVLNCYIHFLNLGAIMIILNFILITGSFFSIGIDFGIKTIYGSFSLSFLYYFLEYLDSIKIFILSINTIFCLFLGVLLSAIGLTIVFKNNASTGGTDIGAVIINKKTGISVGTTLFICDFLIILFAVITFGLISGFLSVMAKIISSVFLNLLNGKRSFRSKKIRKPNMVNDEFIRGLF
jgi:uncharacterized membrane-anchored protein YitT (DUF2179 family)